MKGKGRKKGRSETGAKGKREEIGKNRKGNRGEREGNDSIKSVRVLRSILPRARYKYHDTLQYSSNEIL